MRMYDLSVILVRNKGREEQWVGLRCVPSNDRAHEAVLSSLNTPK